MEQVRSFVAIELPDGLKEELVALQARLRSGGALGVKWVDPYGVHLTISFLGSVPADRLDEVIAALSGAVSVVPRFRLEVRELGAFPSSRRVRVIWVGVSGELDGLQHLHGQVESALAPLGFPAEGRAFTPHLTLGRVREQVPAEERQNLGRLIEQNLAFVSAHRIDVNAIHLMRSTLSRQGAIYSRIGTIDLGGAASVGAGSAGAGELP